MIDCTWKPDNGQQFQPSRPDQRSLVIIWETIEIPPDAFHLDLAWSVIEAACFLHEDVVSWWKTLFCWSFPAPQLCENLKDVILSCWRIPLPEACFSEQVAGIQDEVSFQKWSRVMFDLHKPQWRPSAPSCSSGNLKKYLS